jgi:hypothetical protein
MRILGCFLLIVVAALMGIVSLMYFGGLREKEWQEVRPEGLSEADWEAKRASCETVSMGPAACAQTPTRQVERLARQAEQARREALCREDVQAEAISEAKNIVKAHLKSPSSAKFEASTVRATQKGCDWTVTGEVDAQNSFGASLRSTFRVKLRRVSNDLWFPTAVRVD